MDKQATLYYAFASQGIPNIYKNGVILKIIWTLSFIVSMGYCAFLVYNSITKYLVFEIVTQITSQFGKHHI